MARLLALLAAPAAALAAPTATLLWQQGEPDATYTSAAISLHGAAAAPTFATATSGLDSWPVMLEVYNVSSTDGSAAWQYAAAADNATSFSVAMARHTEGAGAGAVDTVIIEGDKDVASDVWLRGFASLGAGAPAWSLRVPNVRLASGLAVADDGSAAAMTAFIVDAASGQIFPQLLVVDAQSGSLKANVTRALGNPGGPVSMSSTGAWVAWTQGDSVFVYNGATGALRGEAIQVRPGLTAQGRPRSALPRTDQRCLCLQKVLSCLDQDGIHATINETFHLLGISITELLKGRMPQRRQFGARANRTQNPTRVIRC